MGLLDDAIREHLDLKRRRGADPTEIERAEREALGPVRRGPVSAADALAPADPMDEPAHASTRPSQAGWDHPELHTGPDDFDDEPDFHDEPPAPSAPLAADLAGSPLHREDPPAAKLEPETKSRGRGFFRRHHAEPDVEREPVADHEPDPPEVRFEPRPVTPAADTAPQHFDDEDDWDDEDDPFLGTAADLDGPPADEYDEPPPAPRPAPPAPAASHDPYPATPPPVAATPPPSPAPAPPSEPPAPPRRPVAREDLMGETVEYDVEQAFQEDAEEDVLEETPEFLQDTPDHDRLWFEQKPPKDFDFDG